MKNKSLMFILGAVLIGLLGVLALSMFVFQDRGYSLPALKEFKNLNKIEVKKSTNTVLFTQSADKWTVTPPNDTADKTVVDAMVIKLKQMKLTSLLSYGENLEKYNLDTNARVEVTAWQDKKVVAHFYLGKTSPTYSHSYVQLPGNKNVYEMAGNLPETFDKNSIDSFRSKDVTSVAMDDVQEIAFVEGGRETMFVRNTSTITNLTATNDKTNFGKPKTEIITVWKTPKGSAANVKTMEELLTRICKLNAVSFAGEKQEEPKGVLAAYRMKTKLGDVDVTVVRKDTNNNYLVSTAGRKSFFHVNETTIKDIFDKAKAVKAEAGY
ncbi:MAG: DUF4340 domain-containing protein [Spirochaetes bacterium]|nr:DUF4340 domain-containing protein [Spirochaetota bacterium]